MSELGICNPDDIVTSILIKYSNPERDETHCRMSELKRDLVRVMESFMRERDSTQEMLDAWMRVHRDIERNRPFLSRIFA